VTPESSETTKAARARALVTGRAFGVLATNSKRSPGYPFASVMPYMADAEGRPVFLLSRLAVHTKNVIEDPRASLLVFEEGAEEDPLNSARLNLMGEVRRLPESEDADTRAAYVARHPDAAEWLEFGDFGLYRMEVADVYYIGGFGAMGWVSKGDYATAPA